MQSLRALILAAVAQKGAALRAMYGAIEIPNGSSVSNENSGAVEQNSGSALPPVTIPTAQPPDGWVVGSLEIEKTQYLITSHFNRDSLSIYFWKTKSFSNFQNNFYFYFCSSFDMTL